MKQLMWNDILFKFVLLKMILAALMVVLILKFLTLIISLYRVMFPVQHKHVVAYHIVHVHSLETRCPICLCAHTNCARYCGHAFHWTCVRPWLERRDACPLCRTGGNVSVQKF